MDRCMKNMNWIARTVLNIVGVSRHTYHVHISEVIILIIAIILEISSALCLAGAKTICAGQCLLFAKLFERKRVIEGSNVAWCYMPLLFHFAAASSAILLLKFIRGVKHRSQENFTKGLRFVAISTFFVFLAAVIISSGFHRFCQSFVINRCSHDHFMAMDWRSFTPKYSNCSDTYILLQITQVCAWKAFLLMCVLCVTHAIRLFSGLQTSSNS